MEKLKNVATRIAAFVGNNKKPIGIAAVVFLGILVWLWHRDGIKPKESTGDLTVTTSNGEIILMEPEQTESMEEKHHDN